MLSLNGAGHTSNRAYTTCAKRAQDQTLVPECAPSPPCHPNTTPSLPSPNTLTHSSAQVVIQLRISAFVFGQSLRQVIGYQDFGSTPAVSYSTAGAAHTASDRALLADTLLPAFPLSLLLGALLVAPAASFVLARTAVYVAVASLDVAWGMIRQSVATWTAHLVRPFHLDADVLRQPTRGHAIEHDGAPAHVGQRRRRRRRVWWRRRRWWCR